MSKMIKMENIIKIIIILLTICSMFVSTKSYASTIDETLSGADSFVDKGKDYPIDTTELKSTSDFIYNSLLAIAMVIAVIAGMILGIKFMTSDAEGKAGVKEVLVPYIVSCSVVFSAFLIWKIVINILK